MKPANKTSRRRFLENTAIGAIGVIGASQLIRSCSSGETAAGEVVEPSFLATAPDGEPLKAGVVGCGGRGTGAAINFLDAGPNLSIVAAGDVFQDRMDKFRADLKEKKGAELDDSMCFVGFDAYKRVIDSDVDIVKRPTLWPRPLPVRNRSACAARAAGMSIAWPERPTRPGRQTIRDAGPSG